MEDGSGDNKSYDLMLTWEVKREELRPIDAFSGTVTAFSTKGETDAISREKRQDIVDRDYHFVVDGSTTEYTVVDIMLSQEYTVRVCSRNKQGFNCSTPLVLDLDTLLPRVEVGTAEARTDEREKDNAGVIAGVAIAVVIVVLLTIIVLIIACICFCCYLPPTHWISYHPGCKGVFCEGLLCSM